MKPKITVLTATYNSSQTLAWTIQSVLHQEYTDFEYIIIGDACTDDTAEIVSSFKDPRVHFVNLTKNSGSQAVPNNRGLELAQGQWIAYLGHDDLWFPWHLSGLLSTAEQKNSDFVCAMSTLNSPEGLEIVYGVVGHGGVEKNALIPPSSWLHRHTEQRWRDPKRLAIGVDNDFLIRWIKSHGAIAQTERLSVLKYPSAWWGLYQRQNNFPQQVAMQKMQANALLLEHEFLAQAAKLASQLYSKDLSFLNWVRQGLKPTVLKLLMNSPEFFFFRLYSQHLRKISRQKRGLPK